jgi:hypothetical protein
VGEKSAAERAADTVAAEDPDRDINNELNVLTRWVQCVLFCISLFKYSEGYFWKNDTSDFEIAFLKIYITN